MDDKTGKMADGYLRSIGASRHVAQLLAQLVKLLLGHLGGGGGQRVAGGDGGIGRCLGPPFGIMLQALERLEEYQ